MGWCCSNARYKQIYEGLGNVRVFDVSLRDGLKGLNKKEQDAFTTLKKATIFHEVIEKHSPASIESGSLVSNNIYPIFKDTVMLHDFIERDKVIKKYSLQNYIFIPNYTKCIEAIKLQKFTHFSFVTSASTLFLLKNIKKTSYENWEELGQMVYALDNHFQKKDEYKTKIYVSCVSECPIDGKLDNNMIVEKIVQLRALSFDTICLSDTCGTLKLHDFVYIVDRSNERGVPYNKMALHLHVQQGYENIIEEILHAALDRGIVHFDVSYLESGGCSVTINKDALAPNLSYDLYYQALAKYILKKADLQ
jgi:isopropylmalate/homocitrate/citramalate synthase